MKTVLEFAHEVISKDDLDPIYSMLRGAGLPWAFRARWCLAYWMFYNAGSASWIVDGNDFWDRTVQMLPKGPRGRERRHFRGNMAAIAVNRLQATFPIPSQAAHFLTDQTHDAGVIMDRAETWYGFGSWIAFKVADMCSTVLEWDVQFDKVLHRFYVEPLKGAAVVSRAYDNVAPEQALAEFEEWQPAYRLDRLRWALRWLGENLSDVENPYGGGPLRIQELETICCKYKAYTLGRYHIGEDRTAMEKALSESPSEVADYLRSKLTPVPV